MKTLFEEGDEDAREIALDEILRSDMPLAEWVPYLLLDLTLNT